MSEEKEAVLNEVLRLLREKYLIGLYEYLFKHHGEAYNELLRIEDRIDLAFLSGTVDELKSVLRDYWTFHMKAIREFKHADQLAFNLSKAREEKKCRSSEYKHKVQPIEPLFRSF